MAFPVGAKYGSVALTTGLRLPAVAAFRGTFAVLKDDDDEGEEGEESDGGGSRAGGAGGVPAGPAQGAAGGAEDSAGTDVGGAGAGEGAGIAVVKVEGTLPVKAEVACQTKREPTTSEQKHEGGGEGKGPLSTTPAPGSVSAAVGPSSSGRGGGGGGGVSDGQRAGASVAGGAQAFELVSESFVLMCSTEPGSLGLVKGYGDNRFGRFSLRGRYVLAGSHDHDAWNDCAKSCGWGGSETTAH